MKPAVAVLLGLACLAGAGALGAARGGGAARDPAAALGGARTALVGSLFLRAEALRREGRVDEVAAIYRRILDLDPRSDAAADHLADTLVLDVLPLATTPQAQVGWWREAMRLVDEGLARVPGSARLHWRRADLLLHSGGSNPAVAAWLAKQGRDRELEAVAALLEAARESGGIPGLGRIHLEAMARHAPRIAAERLARHAGGVDACLAAGEEVLRLRAAELDELVLDPVPPYAPAAVRLRAGLRLVAHVRDDLAATPPRRDEARDLLSAYVKSLGEDPVSRAVRPLLE